MLSAKRLLFISSAFLFSIFVFVFFLARPAHGQTLNTPYNPSLMPDTDPGVPQNLHTLSNGLFYDGLAFISCQLSGIDPTAKDGKCLGINPKTGKLGYVDQQGGALGFLTKMIVLTFSLPLSTHQYTHYLASNFHFLSNNSYAAGPNQLGIGAQGLSPILKIWVQFRNVSYLLIVIVFLVVGLGIMLRFKIDPRTVMTIQNQIPKIIIGLLVITFSYAISGFLVDMMYVVSLIFLNIIAGAVGNPGAPQQLITSQDPFSTVSSIFDIGGASWTATNTIGGVIQTVISGNAITFIASTLLEIVALPLLLISLFASLSCLPIIGGIFSWANPSGNCNLGLINGGTTVIIELFVWLALIVSIVSSIFRFWLALVTAYVTIFFNVVLAPIRILLGMVPGGPGGGIGGWLRDMIANLMIFPISLSFLFLASEFAKAANSKDVFKAPLVPGGNIGAIMGLAAIFMLPKIPEAVKESFKVKDSLGSGVGQAIGVGMGVGFGAAQAGGKRLVQRDLPLSGQAAGLLRSAWFSGFGVPGLRGAGGFIRKAAEGILGERQQKL